MGTALILKNKWFAKFARKEQIADEALVDAICRAERGLIDADLGGGLIKQRVARQGEGKSSEYRTIIAFREGNLAVFLFGFAKNDRSNLTKDELDVWREVAKGLLVLTADAAAQLIQDGQFTEVRHDERETISQ